MGIYKVVVRELRSAIATYYVEADDWDEAEAQAESGETICEIKGPVQYVCDRSIEAGPIKVDAVPVSVLVAGLTPDKQNGLDDLIHSIKSQEASKLSNGGPEAQVKYIIEQLGLESATEELLGL
jgi:hypothetical protein